MAERQHYPPGIEQGDIGPRYIRKRLSDEMYQSHFIKVGDRIRIQAFLATGVAAAVTTVTLFVGGRVQGMDGQLVQFGDTFAFTVDGAQAEHFVMAPEGYVVDLIATTDTAALGATDVAVKVDIVQGLGSNALPVGLLTSGFVRYAVALGLGGASNIVGGSGGGMAIGGAVSGGTATDILYVGAGALLAQDNNLTWGATNQRVSIGAVELEKIYYIKTTIAHAAILTLPTTVADLIAAPGANKILWPMYAWLVPHYVADYTNVGGVNTCKLYLGWDIAGSQSGLWELQTAGGKLFATGGGTVIGYMPAAAEVAGAAVSQVAGAAYDVTAISVNKAICVAVENGVLGNFTGGNAGNALDVYVQYVILPTL